MGCCPNEVYRLLNEGQIFLQRPNNPRDCLVTHAMQMGYESFIYKSSFLHSSFSHIKFKNVCLGNFHFWQYYNNYWLIFQQHQTSIGTHYLARKSLCRATRFGFRLRTSLAKATYCTIYHHSHCIAMRCPSPSLGDVGPSLYAREICQGSEERNLDPWSGGGGAFSSSLIPCPHWQSTYCNDNTTWRCATPCQMMRMHQIDEQLSLSTAKHQREPNDFNKNLTTAKRTQLHWQPPNNIHHPQPNNINNNQQYQQQSITSTTIDNIDNNQQHQQQPSDIDKDPIKCHLSHRLPCHCDCAA